MNLFFLFFFIFFKGTVLSHKRKVQGKANALCCFALVICAACVCRGVVEVVALLVRSSGASAAVARLGRSLIKSRRRLRISLAQPRAASSGAQRDVVLSLNIDIALLTDELKCPLYAQALWRAM